MGLPLSSYTDSRDNNFNLLRFIAAGMVLVAHSYPLTGTAGEPRFGGLTLGHVAVDIFFITSGFLVTRSLITRGNVVAFTWARFVRIFPALVVAVLLCAFAVGLAFTELSAGEYLSSTRLYTFILKNSTLVLGSIQYDLPGVFTDLTYPEAVNGSLWTLPWEIRMYAVLACMGLASLLIDAKRRQTFLRWGVLVLAVAGLLGTCVNHYSPFIANDANDHGLRLFAFFFVGGACYVLRNRIRLSHGVFVVGALVLVFSQGMGSVFYPLYTCSLAYLILYLAYIPAGPLRSFNKLGDYSYGLYIYAFPVQQMVSALIPDVSALRMFLVASAVTLGLALMSWYLLEKPMLRRKDAYKGFVPKTWL